MSPSDVTLAAWVEYDRRQIWDSGSHRGDARRAFEAGAAEGIRQARAAVVASIERSADYGPHYYPDDVLSAIDALETT